jgi:predicted nucleic acid-binding protein
LIPHVLVIDSSVFNKLYLDEPDRQQALDIFREASNGKLTLFAPSLLYYEVIATCQYYRLPVKTIKEMLDEQIQNYLNLIEPTSRHLEKAIEIIDTGHPKSGYPSIYDAVFHAVAIVENITLITADRKHYAKTHQLGHVRMLDQWHRE